MSACRERKEFSSITSYNLIQMVKRKRKGSAAQHAFGLDLLAAPALSSPAFTLLFPFFPWKPSKIPHFASQPTPPQRILHDVDPHPEKKDLHTHQSALLLSKPCPLSASVPPRRCLGEHSVDRTLWVVILLALLCTFLCIGKEIAFVVATSAHLILQLALGLGLLARGPNVNSAAQTSFYHPEGFDNSVEKDNIVSSNGHMRSLNQSSNRSSTVPRSSGPSFATSNRRSKSWTKLHGSVEGELQPSKVGDSVDSTSSEWATISLPRRDHLFAKLKLQLVLLFTLVGLFHGRFLAMCISLCSILIFSKMERFFWSSMPNFGAANDPTTRKDLS